KKTAEKKSLKKPKKVLLKEKPKAHSARPAVSGKSGKKFLSENLQRHKTSLQPNGSAGASLVSNASAEDKAKAKSKGLEQLLALGKEKGFLTYDEINRILPSHVTSSDEIDDVLVTLNS